MIRGFVVYIKDSYIEQINKKPEIYGHESIIICNPKADTNALKKEYKNYLKSISKNVEVMLKSITLD